MSSFKQFQNVIILIEFQAFFFSLKLNFSSQRYFVWLRCLAQFANRKRDQAGKRSKLACWVHRAQSRLLTRLDRLSWKRFDRGSDFFVRTIVSVTIHRNDFTRCCSAYDPLAFAMEYQPITLRRGTNVFLRPFREETMGNDKAPCYFPCA